MRKGKHIAVLGVDDAAVFGCQLYVRGQDIVGGQIQRILIEHILIPGQGGGGGDFDDGIVVDVPTEQILHRAQGQFGQRQVFVVQQVDQSRTAVLPLSGGDNIGNLEGGVIQVDGAVQEQSRLTVGGSAG